MKPNRPDIELLRPEVERDAPFALRWFEHPEGHKTLLSMGNAAHEIKPPTLEGEKATIQEFLEMESQHRQITRMIRAEGKTIGAVWLELFENHGVRQPSVHIMIGDPEYRGRGIGASVMHSAVTYAHEVLGENTIYSRHLVSNEAIRAVNQSLGFVNDGDEYIDSNKLVWQNIKLDTSG